MLERLQKIIARAGIASRRHAEELIRSGQVRVNGAVVTELGAKADPERDRVEAAGQVADRPDQPVYYLLYKPAHVVATMSDPEGRATLRHVLRGLAGGVFPVGRLEYDISGLMLLTSDGELGDRMLKASARLPKVYWLKVKGRLEHDLQREVGHRAHVHLRPLRAPAAAKRHSDNPWYEAELSDARRDLLRRELFAVGHPVEKMKRVQVGPLDLSNLAEGHYRELAPSEVARLRQSIERAEKAPRPPREKHRRFRPMRQNEKVAPYSEAPDLRGEGLPATDAIAPPRGRDDRGRSRPNQPPREKARGQNSARFHDNARRGEHENRPNRFGNRRGSAHGERREPFDPARSERPRRHHSNSPSRPSRGQTPDKRGGGERHTSNRFGNRRGSPRGEGREPFDPARSERPRQDHSANSSRPSRGQTPDKRGGGERHTSNRFGNRRGSPRGEGREPFDPARSERPRQDHSANSSRPSRGQTPDKRGGGERHTSNRFGNRRGSPRGERREPFDPARSKRPRQDHSANSSRPSRGQTHDKTREIHDKRRGGGSNASNRFGNRPSSTPRPPKYRGS